MNIQENVSMMRSCQYDKRLNLCLKIEVVYEISIYYALPKNDMSAQNL